MTALPAGRAAGRGTRAWFRLGASLLALIATLWLADVQSLWLRVHALALPWAAAALAICSLQLLLLAARWWLIARWLSVPLRYGQALGEYYLSTLLNQVLPLGVLGDALRLARHDARARRDRAAEQTTARVILALVLDRASGQFGLWLVVAAISPAWWSTATAMPPTSALLAAPVAVAMAVGLAMLARGRWPRLRSVMDEGGRSLLAPRKLLLHLPISLLLVATHIVVFAVVARGLGLQLSAGAAVRIVPLVLVAASLPGFFGGWGIREAAAAGLYHLSGSSAADGAAVSLLTGCLGLIASLPGALVWWRQREPVGR